MKLLNETYFENTKALEDVFQQLPPTRFLEETLPIDLHFDFFIDMTDMTEMVEVFSESSDPAAYTVPFLTSFNIIARMLSDVTVSTLKTFADTCFDNFKLRTAEIVGHELNSEFALLLEKEKTNKIDYSVLEFESSICEYVSDALFNISSLPMQYSMNQHLLYFISSMAAYNFDTIPFASYHGDETVNRDELFTIARDGDMSELSYNRMYCGNWLDIINTSLFAIACSEKYLRKCKLCGKYFIPENRSDEMYCRFPNESRGYKPCKDAYKRIAQDEREQNNEALRLNKLIYNRLLNRNVDELNAYIERRNKVKPKRKGNEAADTAYLEWLREEERNTRIRKK